MALWQVYLQQGQGSGAGDEAAELNSERWTEIAKLLSRKHDRIDPLHALSLLPDGVRCVWQYACNMMLLVSKGFPQILFCLFWLHWWGGPRWPRMHEMLTAVPKH